MRNVSDVVTPWTGLQSITGLTHKTRKPLTPMASWKSSVKLHATTTCTATWMHKPIWRPESCLWEESKLFWIWEAGTAQTLGLAIERNRKKPLVWWATYMGQEGQGKPQQLMTETLIKNLKTKGSDVTNNLHRAGWRYHSRNTEIQDHLSSTEKTRLELAEKRWVL